MSESRPPMDLGSSVRFAFDNALDAIVLLDRHGRLTLANQAARALPVAPERLFAREWASWASIEALRDETRAHGRASIELAIATSAGPRQMALHATTDGDAIAITVRDVTDSRRVESELRHLRRMESVGHLTASVVHDFNNLLTPIVCLSGLLEKELKQHEHLGELARDVKQASERAATLVRQVLAFARRAPARAGRLNVAATVVELRALIERVAGAGVELDLDLGDESGEALVDREQFEHVLLNLAANARDAMPRGGRLAVRIANVDLDADGARRIDGSRAGAYVAIVVNDTGVGMTSEVRERIFEGFFTTKPVGEGTGLGLAAARRFVADAGGCIAVHSEPGRGTTIALYLPRADAPARALAPSSPGDEPLRGSEHVLVLDDDAFVRGAMRAVLEEHGYVVHEAASGEDAVAIARDPKAPIDLLVVDVVLGSMSGRDVATRVRAVRSSVRILFTSGHTARILERHGLSEDDPRLLRKAFTPRELARKVREVLDGVAERTSASEAS